MINNPEDFNFPDFQSSKPAADSPVYPPLMTQMKVDLVLNPDSDVWMIYERPLPEVMKWIEYDIEMESLILVSLSGKIQSFGMKVPAAMKKYLCRAKRVYAVRQDEGGIQDMSIVPLVVRAALN